MKFNDNLYTELSSSPFKDNVPLAHRVGGNGKRYQHSTNADQNRY